MRKCPKCKQLKDKNEFGKDKSQSSGLNTYCKVCAKEKHKLWILSNPEKARNIDLKHKHSRTKEQKKNWDLRGAYGISLVEFNKLIENQNSKCAICQRITDQFCVDHDHKTGKVRGALCRSCNSVIGFAGDNAEILFNAIKYLEVNKE